MILGAAGSRPRRSSASIPGTERRRRSGRQVEPIGPGSKVMKIKDGGRASGEAGVALAVARRTRSLLLARGYRVAMTRTGPTIPLRNGGGNIARAQFCNRRHAALMVRIHADGSRTRSLHGISTLVPAWHRGWTNDIYAPSLRAGRMLQRALVQRDRSGRPRPRPPLRPDRLQLGERAGGARRGRASLEPDRAAPPAQRRLPAAPGARAHRRDRVVHRAPELEVARRRVLIQAVRRASPRRPRARARGRPCGGHRPLAPARLPRRRASPQTRTPRAPRPSCATRRASWRSSSARVIAGRRLLLVPQGPVGGRTCRPHCTREPGDPGSHRPDATLAALPATPSRRSLPSGACRRGRLRPKEGGIGSVTDYEISAHARSRAARRAPERDRHPRPRGDRAGRRRASTGTSPGAGVASSTRSTTSARAPTTC